MTASSIVLRQFFREKQAKPVFGAEVCLWEAEADTDFGCFGMFLLAFLQEIILFPVFGTKFNIFLHLEAHELKNWHRITNVRVFCCFLVFFGVWQSVRL